MRTKTQTKNNRTRAEGDSKPPRTRERTPNKKPPHAPTRETTPPLPRGGWERTSGLQAPKERHRQPDGQFPGVDERYSAEEGLNTSPHHHQVAPLSVQRQI
ncbi:hypothetical protein Pcinc_001446 [Petrolisthes cinctipes]|uniref:Uncharacterized protein n=1 Tax=Petrolisthes cinctipes TaxID=88211 RepID=A0AAE1GKS9_PETCI|nr:hypothetical protein Pcinc_001446 [Petrolisthes cinctipes]